MRYTKRSVAFIARGFVVIALAGSSVLLDPAWAQSPLDRQRGQIESRQDDQLDKLKDRLESPSETLGGNIRPVGEQLKQSDGEGPQLLIREVEIKGNTLLNKKFTKKIKRKYEGRKLGLVDVENLQREITNEHIRLGYTTSRAFLPPQDLLTERLVVKVVEGRVEKVRFKKESPKSFRLGNTFPKTKGKILNIRDFEQGIDQSNRLKSNKAKLDFAPGEEQGMTQVLVKNEAKKRWYLGSSFNNHGLDIIGRYQTTNSLTLENFARFNEQVSFTYGADVSGRGDGHFNDMMGANVSVPFGYWLVSGGYFRSTYLNTSQIFDIDIYSEGETNRYFMNLSRVLYRDKNQKVKLSLGLDHKSSKNWINDVLLVTASRKLTELSLVGSYETRLREGKAFFQASLGYHRGLTWLGAKDDDDRFVGEPYAQYDTITASAAYVHKFTIKKKPITYSGYLSAQYAPREVFSTEGINLGGQPSVRGFRNESVVGSSGVFMRHEISLPLLDLEKKWGKKSRFIKGKISTYAHYDAGILFGKDIEDIDEGLLQGAGLGIRFTDAPITFDTGIHFPLSQPDSIQDKDPIFSASLSLSY